MPIAKNASKSADKVSSPDLDIYSTIKDLSQRGVGRGTASEGYSVHDGDILIFGDLHLTSSFNGSHKDYTTNCVRVMTRIMEIVDERAKSDRGLAAIFFLGDVFGVKDRELKDIEFSVVVIQFFQYLNSMCSGNVYTVRGNHDFGECPEFHRFELLGLLKNPEYVDYIAEGNTEVRFHFVNYGAEHRQFNMVRDEETSNVALAHNDFQIEGVTDWYGDKSAIDTSRLTNFLGMAMLISGHIHTPSSGTYSVIKIGDGGTKDSQVLFFNPGCPTRVSERYEDCYYMVVSYSPEAKKSSVDAFDFGLWPVDEEFHVVPEDELPNVDTDEELRKERLGELLEKLRDQKVYESDLSEMIKTLPLASEKAKLIALENLELANR